LGMKEKWKWSTKEFASGRMEKLSFGF
jgi:hypothetical protein